MTPTAGHQAGTNYTEQGAIRTVIEGDLDVASGGELDIEDGAEFKLAGVQVTSRSKSTVAVAAEAADNIDVTITLKDGAGVAISGARPVRVLVSSSATTGAIATDDGITVTATTGLLITHHVTDLLVDFMTSVAGVLVVRVAGVGDLTGKFLWIDTPGFPAPLVSAVVDHA